MTITKAVLACGGWSTRFLPTTKAYAKQLLPIMDKPQILYLLEECLNSGLNEICIVQRQGETTIQEFLSPNPELDKYLADNNKEKYLEDFRRIMTQIKSLVFLPQTDKFPYGNGSPVLVAQKFINNQPFAYFYGDDFILENKSGDFLSSLISTFNSRPLGAVCAVTTVAGDHITKLSSVKYLQDNQIEVVIEKPQLNEIYSHHSLIGRFVFLPHIIDVLKSTPISKNELWLTHAINSLASDKSLPVLTQTIPDGSEWITTGDPINWLKANIAVARQMGLEI